MELSVEPETSVERLKASEIDLKNIVYCETDARQVADYKFAKMPMSAQMDGAS
jgi:hypothetical protein